VELSNAVPGDPFPFSITAIWVRKRDLHQKFLFLGSAQAPQFIAEHIYI